MASSLSNGPTLNQRPPDHSLKLKFGITVEFTLLIMVHIVEYFQIFRKMTEEYN